MPLYPQAVRRLLPLDKNMDPAVKARVAILHVASSEGPSLYPYFNGPSGGVESHFYIRYDGTVEQYRDTDYQADANVMANGFAVSIETEGLANGTWTDAQLASIKALLVWLHAVESIPLSVPKTWDGTGVGYHVLFEAQWDQRHASCPGPNRIKQFTNVLVPWMRAGAATTPKEFTVADANDAKVLWDTDLTLKGSIKPPVSNESPLDILTRVARNVETIAALVKAQDSAQEVAAAVVAALPAGNLSAHDIAAEIIAQLTPKES